MTNGTQAKKRKQEFIRQTLRLNAKALINAGNRLIQDKAAIARIEGDPELMRVFEIARRKAQEFARNPTEYNSAESTYYIDAFTHLYNEKFNADFKPYKFIIEERNKLLRSMPEGFRKRTEQKNYTVTTENLAARRFWDRTPTNDLFIDQETADQLQEAIKHGDPKRAAHGSGRVRKVKGKLVFEPIATSTLRLGGHVAPYHLLKDRRANVSVLAINSPTEFSPELGTSAKVDPLHSQRVKRHLDLTPPGLRPIIVTPRGVFIPIKTKEGDLAYMQATILDKRQMQLTKRQLDAEKKAREAAKERFDVETQRLIPPTRKKSKIQTEKAEALKKKHAGGPYHS